MNWLGYALRLILLAILNGKFENFLCIFGLVCSSWVTISQGTHNRSPWFPLGLEHIPFVAQGNELTSRTFLGADFESQHGVSSSGNYIFRGFRLFSND